MKIPKNSLLVSALAFGLNLGIGTSFAETRNVEGNVLGVSTGGDSEAMAESHIKQHTSDPFFRKRYLDEVCNKELGPGWLGVKDTAEITNVRIERNRDMYRGHCLGYRFCDETTFKGVCTNR